MKNKQITVKEAAAMVKDGMTIMTGGFVYVGYPKRIIDALVESGVKDLTLISNDHGTPTTGVGKMILNKQIKKAIASHIGKSPESGQQMNKGELEMELVPQGTLVERIRCGGAGLGGFFTPTGVGTEVEQGKQKIEIDGKEYLVELPLRSDIAFIKASVADKRGNLVLNKTSKNFNVVMALAADIVVAEVDEIVEVGEIDPERVTIPGNLVDFLVGGEND